MTESKSESAFVTVDTEKTAEVLAADSKACAVRGKACAVRGRNAKMWQFPWLPGLVHRNIPKVPLLAGAVESHHVPTNPMPTTSPRWYRK